MGILNYGFMGREIKSCTSNYIFCVNSAMQSLKENIYREPLSPSPVGSESR